MEDTQPWKTHVHVIVINDTHTKNRREHGFIELNYEIQCELHF